MATAARSTPPVRLTTAQYLALPTDDERTELIYGELVMSPGATGEHNDLVYYIRHIVGRWAEHKKTGRVYFDIDMVLDEDGALVYRPDVLFFGVTRADRYKHGRLYGPADLCVEVRSPSDRPSVQRRKFADYERYGVAWFWIVNPDAPEPAIEEYENVDGKFVCRAEVAADQWFSPGLFPGLSLRLAPLLAGEGVKAAVKGRAKKLM